MPAPASVKQDLSPSDIRGTLTLKQCVEHIGRIYIEHDAITHALGVLEFPGLRAHEASTGYIIGHSRCGKSETIARYIRETTGVEIKKSGRPHSSKPDVAVYWCEGKGKRIVLADMTNGATPLIASRLILQRAFNDVKPPTTRAKTEPEAAVQLIDFFMLNHVDKFIVDEAQQMFRGHGTHAIEKMSSWLLPFENSGLRSVFVGDLDMELLHEAKVATNLRKGGNGRLLPFGFRTPEQKDEFEYFLTMFAKDLPFDADCLLTKDGDFREEMLFPFYFTTRGLPGEMAKLCEYAAYFAAKKKPDHVVNKITKEHFAAAFDFNWRHDVRMGRFNPFSDDIKKAPPEIPLCYDEQRQIELEKAGRRPGRQIYSP